MTPTRTRELLNAHGLEAHKHLGQHFLADQNMVAKIVRLLDGGPGAKVLEIGAGLGALTLGLAASGFAVLAYEVDVRLLPALEEVLADVPSGQVVVEIADATSVDFASRLSNDTWLMASNLPYNVGTGVLLDLLREAPQIAQFVVMVQAEVADRLVAKPGSKVYGIPSVVTQLHAVVGERFSVPPQVFVPPPSVDSAVLELRRRPDVPASAEDAIELAGLAFGQRRKMLRSSLPLDEATIERAGLDPRSRPESVSPEGFVRLAEAAGTG